MPLSDEPLLDAAHAAFIQSGISMGIAASTRDAIPSHVRALGCRVSPDRRQLTVFVSVTHARKVLECIRDNGNVAAVFTDPPTHRTVQLKGSDAKVVPLDHGDLELIDSYRTAFVETLKPLGFSEAGIRTLLSCPPTDIAGICFTPAEAYSQTPGPKAGERLARPV